MLCAIQFLSELAIISLVFLFMYRSIGIDNWNPAKIMYGGFYTCESDCEDRSVMQKMASDWAFKSNSFIKLILQLI
jgi:hypothetical protein